MYSLSIDGKQIKFLWFADELMSNSDVRRKKLKKIKKIYET